MIKKDISQENIGILREGFKQYFAEHYAELSHRDVICSDAFFIFREDIGITPEEIFELQDGLELLMSIKKFTTVTTKKLTTPRQFVSLLGFSKQCSVCFP